jgi:hypothetical protein
MWIAHENTQDKGAEYFTPDVKIVCRQLGIIMVTQDILTMLGKVHTYRSVTNTMNIIYTHKKRKYINTLE